MAKKPAYAAETAQPEEEMQVVVLKFKGSGETLRRGMDTVSQAIAALGGPAAVTTRTISGKPAARLTPGAAPAGEPDPAAAADESAEETADEDIIDVQASPAGPKPPRKNKPPKFDSKLKVVPFKAFAAERNPQTVDEKYLVSCLWLQEHADLPSYGSSQILTCIRTMEWTEYDDFTSPMRIMKRDKGYYDNTVPRLQWKLTDNGLDVARKIKHPAKA